MSFWSSERFQRHISQAWKFGVTGGIGATVDLTSLTILIEHFHISRYVAPVYSTALAIIVVFIGNKFFTFRNRSKAYSSQAIKFAIVYGVAIVSNLCITWLLIRLGFHYLIARCAAIGVGMVWNYSMSHAFVFKKNEELMDIPPVV